MARAVRMLHVSLQVVHPLHINPSQDNHHPLARVHPAICRGNVHQHTPKSSQSAAQTVLALTPKRMRYLSTAAHTPLYLHSLISSTYHN